MFILSATAQLLPETNGSDTRLPESGQSVSSTRRPARLLVLRVFALVGAIVIYGVYRNLRVGAGRDVFSGGLPVQPFRHALSVLDVEHAVGLDFERGLQQMVIGYRFVIQFANAYYSWAHQAMTLGLVAILLLRAPLRAASRWVGALLLQLPIGLALFRLYPLMPPRLLDAGAPWGGRIMSMHRELRPTGIVDTLVKVRGPWSPAPVALDAFTNQFAAMPSLHCGFAVWVGVVWWRWAKGKSWRFVGPLHTATIFFCVVVTGNHYVLDAVVGWGIALFMLGVTGRFSGILGWLGSLGRSYGTGAGGATAYGDGVQGDNSLIPSTTSISQ